MKITIFEHQGSPESAPGKYFYLDKNGLQKGQNGALVSSKAGTFDLESLAELKDYFDNQLDYRHHLTCGIFKDSRCHVLADWEVGFLKYNGVKVHPDSGFPLESRTNVSLTLPDVEADMVVDSDGMKGLPWPMLVDAVPALEGIGHLWGVSSSSNIYDGKTQLKDAGSYHTHIVVKNGRDIPRALEVLHKRLILAGHGMHALSKDGRFLERSPVDLAMRVPSQPIYLHPRLLNGLTQKKVMTLVEGDVLDTEKLLPDLNTNDLNRLDQLLMKARKKLQPEAINLCKKASKERIAKSVARGMPEQEAVNSVYRAVIVGVLDDSALIHLSKDEVVTVREIKADPEKYNGMNCLDPLEPSYQGWSPKGKIYLSDKSQGINSFAHGQTYYKFSNEKEVDHTVDELLDTFTENFLKQTGQQPVGKTQRSSKGSMPIGFFFNNNGLYYKDPADKEGNGTWVCGQLKIVGKTTDDQNHNWGKIVEFTDQDKKLHKVVIPLELFSGDGGEVRRILLKQGLSIGSSGTSKHLLSQYIQQANVKKLTRCVDKTGWYRENFVLPDEVIGSNDEVILQNTSGDYSCYGVNGSLAEWQDNVSKYCIGNSRLVLSVSAAFASPIISLINMESGGIHFRGGSSKGKTTALHVASSVWGNSGWMKKWRATDNGIEGVAVVHNNALLALDEVVEMEPKACANVTYMLGNGRGKSRSDRNGNTKPVKSWNLLFLSTGEISIAQHIESGGIIPRAGQEVRALDVAVDTGKYGLFEDLHGFKCGSLFATHLNNNSENYYGIASRAFLKELVFKKNFVVEYLDGFTKNFIESLNIADANGQVKRAALRFAVIAAAGEIATRWGITGWPENEATNAAKVCFEIWKANRGGEQSQEQMQALALVTAFLEAHGASRFSLLGVDRPSEKVINRAGFKKIENSIIYYFLKETFKKEVCKGFDHTVVLNALKAKGALKHQQDRLTSQVVIQGTKLNLYTVDWSALIKE